VTSGRDRFLSLRDGLPQILPSLLTCDFGNLPREVGQMETAGIRCLHLDVMDGCFVPNLTFGMPIVAGLRGLTELSLDVHLMIDRPRRFLRDFVAAGADAVTVHVEAVEQPREVLREIRDLGAASGIALNPATPMAAVEPCLEDCDLVLVMSVPAGFGGQSFDEIALEKLRHLREMGGPDLMLEVDGGVNSATIERCAAAGAQLFVVGSAIFQSTDYHATIEQLNLQLCRG
jgi:ribulose-phosphate 3-epimerase